MPPFKLTEMDNDYKKERDEAEPIKSDNINNQIKDTHHENDNGYSQAFLALKEPE